MKRALTPALLALASAAALGWFSAARELDALTGVRLLQLPDDPAAGDVPLARHRVAGIELPRHGQQHLPWRRVRARFTGHVHLAGPGEREWRVVAGSGSAVVRVDGRELLVRAADAAAPAARARIDLGGGSHAVEVDYESSQGPHLLRLLLAPEPGAAPERLHPDRLFPEPPSPERIARVGRLRGQASAALVLLGVAAAALAAPQLRRIPAAAFGELRHALPVLVILFAGLLRLESLVAVQWQERAPLALRSLAVVMWDLHPAGLRPLPREPGYEGDPFTYLRFAREMRGFYDAHVREPVFVATARGFLELLGGADVGLALASVFYSTLLVAATYLLGASFFSPAVGLLAALPLALERESVAFSPLGWRDEAFAFFAALTLAALRRLLDKPGFGIALGTGLVAALACLTRITALAFVVPCLALAIALGGRQRESRTALLVGGAVFVAALSPYLLACWIALGDPFISINAHTRFYRAGAGLPFETPMNVARFLTYERGPFELLDTGLVGLTAYPFLNKWRDFDDWLPGASWLLGAAALGGLLAFCLLPRGRLLLLALFSSLLPYAFTWEVPGGGEWRFTLHAYPFYLVAAAWALCAAFERASRWVLLRAVAAGALALPAVWLAASALHFLRVREELHAGKPASVRAGPRDAFLLARGWSPLRRVGTSLVREAGPEPAVLRLPLAEGRAYRATLLARAAAACAAPCDVSVTLDGRPAGQASLTGPDEDEQGPFSSTALELEADAARKGFSRLELRGGPLALRLLRLDPLPP